MSTGYGARLSAVTATRGRLCVGVDPHPSLLAAWGLDPGPTGLERFARGVVEALGDQVAVFKPQSAFFERLGSAGVAVLERVLADIARTGALSLLDAKRGDIGSTMDAYAEAYLDDASPLAADALTVNPYLGVASLEPAIERALASGRGLYLLARTSNPGNGEVQAARTDGRTVAQAMIDAVAARNAAETPGTDVLGSLGVVVGGTVQRGEVDLSAFNGSVLVPGVGFQGGTIADVGQTLTRPELLLPSSSRGVLAAGPDPSAMRAAVAELLAQVAALDAPAPAAPSPGSASGQ